jgi:DNA polymerase-3 subunit delta
VGLLMRRLEGQGVLPVTICIAALRHFRGLHTAASDPGGVSAGLMRARVFGPRRDQMQRQASDWGRDRLETAIGLLLDTDLTLRSSSRAPTMALLERALLRIALTRR